MMGHNACPKNCVYSGLRRTGSKKYDMDAARFGELCQGNGFSHAEKLQKISRL
jgi:hypothetical protein